MKRSKSALVALLVVFTSYSCFQRSTPPVQQQPSPTPSVSQRPLPERSGPVSDYANAFEPDAEKRLEFMIEELRRDTGVELAVLTVDTTHEKSMFDFSLAVANSWNLGGTKGRGLLLVLANKDRQWRLQVSRALESDLPDEVCRELAEPSLELYKQGKYAEGVERYIRAIGDRLRRTLSPTL